MKVLERINEAEQQVLEALSASQERVVESVTNARSAVAEHCRSIRTNILFSATSRPMRVITMSSPRQGEAVAAWSGDRSPP